MAEPEPYPEPSITLTFRTPPRQGHVDSVLSELGRIGVDVREHSRTDDKTVIFVPNGERLSNDPAMTDLIRTWFRDEEHGLIESYRIIECS
jgi:hypothetical protein